VCSSSAGEDLAAEFLQGGARADRIAAHLRDLLADPERRCALSGRLLALRRRLGAHGSARRAAEIVLQEASG
jgi:lipid A disaccharide synthetase